MSNERDDDTVDDLTALGWRQGSFITAVNGLTVPFLKSTGAASVSVDTRRVKAKERLVVASHACDLARPVRVEPYAEVLVCSWERRGYLPKLKGSPRTFVIDDETGLVVNAKYRVLVEKQVLAGLDPEAWPSITPRQADAVETLASAFGRALNPKSARLVAPPTTAPLQRVSAHEYLRTQAIPVVP